MRIGRTDSTWPKVGELTLVSTDAHCTVLSRFVGVDLQRHGAIAAEPDVALEHGVQLARARTDDHVPRGIAELPGGRKREGRGVEELIDRRIAQLNRLRRCSRRAAIRSCRAPRRSRRRARAR